MNHTLVELMRAMMIAQPIPAYLWPEAIMHTAYLRNHIHTWVLECATPHEKWLGKRPNVSHLQEFGAPVWIMTEGQNLSKLEPRSKEYIFMGFMDGPKAVRYYDMRTCLIKVSRNYH